MIKRINKNLRIRPKFDVDDISGLFGYKICSRKLVKLNGTRKSHPTACGLKKVRPFPKNFQINALNKIWLNKIRLNKIIFSRISIFDSQASLSIFYYG